MVPALLPEEEKYSLEISSMGLNPRNVFDAVANGGAGTAGTGTFSETCRVRPLGRLKVASSADASGCWRLISGVLLMRRLSTKTIADGIVKKIVAQRGAVVTRLLVPVCS